MSKINFKFNAEGFQFKTADGNCALPKLSVDYDAEFDPTETVEAMKGFNTAFTSAFEQAFKATSMTPNETPAPTPSTASIKQTDNFCEVENKSNQIKFGKLYLNKDNGIPTLELIGNHGTFYMSWFRGYRIQVSGTMDGGWNYGASPVMAYYKDLFGSSDTVTQTNIIDMAAMTAIAKFSQYAGWDQIPPRTGFSDIYAKWLDETVKYTFGTDESNVVICDEYYRETEPGVWEEIPYAERKSARKAEAKVADAKAENDEE